MRKVCLFLILMLFTCQFASAFSFKNFKSKFKSKKSKKQETVVNHQWKMLDDNIFVDTSSIKKKKKTNEALFKVYTLQNFGYQQKQYKAYCKKNLLEIKSIENYDNNGTLLNKEKLPVKLRSDIKGVAAGEIYFNTLCK